VTENVYYTHCAELGKNSLSLKMYRVSQLSVDLEIKDIYSVLVIYPKRAGGFPPP